MTAPTSHAEDITLVSITAIKQLVDQLADLGIDPLHLHVDGHKPTDPRPDVRLWLRYRTDFDAYVQAAGISKKKIKERPYLRDRQREVHVEHDTAERRLLITCVSFPHHPDWAQVVAS